MAGTHQPHDFGDNVAAALHQNAVADLDAQPRDFILVVERGTRHCDAADIHGFQVGYRSQGAGAANLYFDVFDGGLGLVRGKLEGNGPARRFGGPAQAPCCRTESTFSTTPSIS